MRNIDITGQCFGAWTAICRDTDATTLHQKWVCQCECGITRSVSKNSLMSGRSASCGCKIGRVVDPATIVMRHHGYSRTKLYAKWQRMKERCTSPAHSRYHRYGGRGISVCDRWMVFENFLADMGFPPPGFTLERVDVNGNYEPSNCIWADFETQNNNQCGQKKYLVNGEWLGLMQLSRHLGISKFKTKKLLSNYQVKTIGENHAQQ